VAESLVAGNGSAGIDLDDSTAPTVTGNHIRDNGGAVSLSRVSQTWLLDNFVCENSDPQIAVGDDVDDVRISEHSGL